MTASVASRTLSEVFSDTAAKFGLDVAISDTIPKDGSSHTVSEQFEKITYTWNQYKDEACSFAKALIAYGVQPKRAVVIQGSNSSKWLFTNIGTILAGCISSGVYHANGKELSQHSVIKSDAQVVVVEDEAQLKKYVGLKSKALKCFVVWNKVQDEKLVAELSKPVFSWDEFIIQGKKIGSDKLDSRIKSQKPDDICSIIFTSGTTGLPKACALTHNNFTWTAEASGKLFSLDSSQQSISYLPLNHIAAQQLDCIAPLTFGYKVDIAPKDALKNFKLMHQQMTNTRPSYFLAVPRIWEKLKIGIIEKLQATPIHKRALFYLATTLSRWAFHNLEQISRKNLAALSVVDRVMEKVARFILTFFENVAFRKIKSSMGLDCCKIAASATAEIDPNLVDFFAGLNLRILDMYGMSETSGPITLSRGLDTPRGSCGKPLDGTQVVIARLNDEICIKGPNVMKEYYNSREETKKAFDENGFLYTGDAGCLDQQGNLFVTGRIKELIMTTSSDIIAPVPIEQAIKGALPFLAYAVVIGNKRPYLTCLLTLRRDPNNPNLLAKEVIDLLALLGSSAMTPKEAIKDARLCKYVKKGIEKANVKAGSNEKRVMKFELLEDDFSADNDLMTPTQKLKRNVIEDRYKDVIEKMYEQIN